jgi:hypothetical protein
VELFSILRRRWILASILLLLTLAATVSAFIKLPTTYQATSSIVFLAPKSAAKAYGGNTYLAFNSTLNQTADVVRYQTNDVRTANALAGRGDTSTYLVTDATDTAGPVLVVTVTGSDKANVERTLQGVTNQVTANLSGLQVGLPRNDRITDDVITFVPTPTAMTSKKLRPLSVVGGVGLVLTIGIPIIVDAILLRRRPDPRRPAGEWPERRPQREDLGWRIESREAPSAGAEKVAVPADDDNGRPQPAWKPTERSGRRT